MPSRNQRLVLLLLLTKTVMVTGMFFLKCNTSQLLLRAYCVLGPPPISLHFPLARQEGVEFFFLIISFTYLWLCWVFVAMWALSNCSELAYSPAASFSFRWPPLLQLPRSVHNSCAWLRCPTACGIFPDQGWNLCLLHWQADSLPLSLQGSPIFKLLSTLLPSFSWDIAVKILHSKI